MSRRIRLGKGTSRQSDTKCEAEGRAEVNALFVLAKSDSNVGCPACSTAAVSDTALACKSSTSLAGGRAAAGRHAGRRACRSLLRRALQQPGGDVGVDALVAGLAHNDVPKVVAQAQRLVGRLRWWAGGWRVGWQARRRCAAPAQHLHPLPSPTAQPQHSERPPWPAGRAPWSRPHPPSVAREGGSGGLEVCLRASASRCTRMQTSPPLQAPTPAWHAPTHPASVPTHPPCRSPSGRR